MRSMKMGFVLTGAAWMAAMGMMASAAETATASITAHERLSPEGEAAQRKMHQDAKTLKPLVKEVAALEFLNAAELLPEPPARTVYRNREKGSAVSAKVWEKMTAEERTGFAARACTPEFYYSTGYGSPLVYARVLDILGKQGIKTLEGKRVMDFGAGTIGHVRAMGLAGADAHGVDVEQLLGALYSEEEDQGKLTEGKQGQAWLHIGRWPAEKDVVEKVGTGFDIITSKNTLKEGYIHPKPPKGKTVDARQIIALGVDDATFLKSVHDALKPGGVFVIYNICPAQSDANDLSKPYIPWADGKSPFSREQFAAAGLEVLELDVVDAEWAIDAFAALGYANGASKEEMGKTTFCWYTVAKRPSQGK